jgi:hypothetical protein
VLYKTIVLDMLQDQYPSRHERLRTEHMLRTALEATATELNTTHD